MKTEQFYDKFLSRMDKMCGSLDKIARMLEAMQKNEQKNRELPPDGELVVPIVHLEAKTTDSPYGNITIE